jgi:hypothetical protein
MTNDTDSRLPFLPYWLTDTGARQWRWALIGTCAAFFFIGLGDGFDVFIDHHVTLFTIAFLVAGVTMLTSTSDHYRRAMQRSFVLGTGVILGIGCGLSAALAVQSGLSQASLMGFMLVSSLPYGAGAAGLAGLLLLLMRTIGRTDTSRPSVSSTFCQRYRWAAALITVLYLVIDVLGIDVIPAGAHRVAIDACAFIVVPGATALMLMPTVL